MRPAPPASFRLFLFLALAIGLAAPAQAHRANVFAYAEGDTIRIECSFSGGRAAMNAPVEIRDAASGELLATITTDRKGEAALPVPAAARENRPDLSIVLLAGQGHLGEWLLTAEEYLGAAPADAPDSQPAAATESAPAPAAQRQPGTVDHAALEALVARAVSREVAPMRRSLAAMADSGPTASDVFAGIGYILGLFGIAAWMKSRKAGA